MYINIEYERITQKVSYETLSRTLKMNRNTLRNKLSGKNKFYYEELEKLSKVFNKSVDYLAEQSE